MRKDSRHTLCKADKSLISCGILCVSVFYGISIQYRIPKEYGFIKYIIIQHQCLNSGHSAQKRPLKLQLLKVTCPDYEITAESHKTKQVTHSNPHAPLNENVLYILVCHRSKKKKKMCYLWNQEKSV